MYAILEEKEKTEFQRAKVALLCTYGCLSNSTQKKILNASNVAFF